MGTHKNRCLATFFERSTVRIPSIHTRRQIYTRLHTTLKKLRSETTLCIYCTRGQSHSLPFLRCVSQSATHITHTNIHVHHAPSTRFLTLESFLLSPIDNLYETNIPLFPSCSILASPRLESNPAMWTVIHPYRRSHVKRTFTCTLATIFPYLKLLSTDRIAIVSSADPPVRPSIIVLSMSKFPNEFSHNPCPQYPGYVPASELALIFVILVMHKLHIMIIIVNDT